MLVGDIDGLPDGMLDDGLPDGMLDGSADAVTVGPKEALMVGTNDGVEDGPDEGPIVGVVLEVTVGIKLGKADGALEGANVGAKEGKVEGTRLGVDEGNLLGEEESVGCDVGFSVIDATSLTSCTSTKGRSNSNGCLRFPSSTPCKSTFSCSDMKVIIWNSRIGYFRNNDNSITFL